MAHSDRTTLRLAAPCHICPSWIAVLVGSRTAQGHLFSYPLTAGGFALLRACKRFPDSLPKGIRWHWRAARVSPAEWYMAENHRRLYDVQ